ncbi:pyruvate dehydrogenase complex dihydrolipoamide acetyltransferase [Lichenibacterium minor]|uniref:Acetyltransferase component of pyruvate dehydrogenase complex n=1 Tax=Lichenibacterium minor TaxID=2316528 RepID=A0A4Q2UEM1_9HYPH|nr:pyruvate dehydrogenase complex dihydrolipoamide acetyltransferase [Lichenibacterium minor]RYC33677.1 pyruvate dehydrogenase complex dihydrolipoamide acetyltransferase [Lichenibacterium minor]
MPTNILMPALSPTMEKGNLAKWLKKEGDAIKSGDVIAEIETDKATMEVEAVDEGVLAKIVVPEGTADVPVNELIGLIAADGEDVSAVAAGGGAKAPATPAPASAAPPPQAASAGDLTVPEGHQYERAPELKPVDAKPAAGGAAPAPQAGGGAQPASGRVFASPLARRVAKEAGLDVASVKGSGPHGRIVERDVRSAIANPPKAAAAPAPAPQAAPAAAPAPAAAAPKPAGASDEQVKKMFPAGSFEEVPHDGMRKTIARRLTEAKQTIPHFYLSADCELDALMALREQVNGSAPKDKDGKPAFKLSVNDFIIKALALALKRVPEANVSWTDGAMLKHKHADVGVAVSIPGGLITPIVRAAETKTLSTISGEVKDMASRAKSRKLKPTEYEGGTTAVSNLGMFGVKNFQAIVNPPHATILAVGAGEKRVVVKGGEPKVATVMTVTLSTDHRAVDGALGAELMSAFKDFIEHPMSMLV